MRVVNRDGSVTKTAYIAPGLTRVITLGGWQWCPAQAVWPAGVLADGSRPVELSTNDHSKPHL